MIKSKKIKITLINLILIIVLFVGMLLVEKNILKPNGSFNGLIAINDVAKGTLITEQNINSLFKEKDDIDGELQVNGVAKTKEELLNLIANENLNKGEIISMDSFITKNSILKDIKDPVETSFNVTDISQVVGGTLRKGDLIDISVIDNNTNESTEVLKNVYVEKAISSDGKEIDRSSDLSAITINIIVSKTDEAKLNNHISKGGIRVSKIDYKIK